MFSNDLDLDRDLVVLHGHLVDVHEAGLVLVGHLPHLGASVGRGEGWSD